MLALFGRKKTNRDAVYADDLVGCLGKIPAHAEFIKHGIRRAQAAQLDQWYQAAFNEFSRESANAKSTFLTMPSYSFIQFAAHGPIIGTLGPSQDKSGRAYPFVIFRFIENPLVTEFKASTPLLYQDYFARAHEVYQQNFHGQTVPELFAAVNELRGLNTGLTRRSILETTLASWQRVLFDDYWQSLTQFYPALDAQRFFSRVFDELKDIESLLACYPCLAVKFPLASENYSVQGVMFWLQLLRFILKQHDSLIQIFWHRDHAQHHPALTIFVKPIPAELFKQLVIPDQTVPGFIDFTQMPACAAAPTMTGLRLSDKNLYEALNQISGCWQR